MKVFIALVCLVGLVVSQETQTTQRPTTPAPPPTEPPVDCDISVGEDDWAVLLPNPKSCDSYYVCDAGEPIFMPCPEGLHFNAELCVCDWPESANCTVRSVEAAPPS